MPFVKGDQKPKRSGRRKGVTNKATREVREALLEAFNRAGGIDYLTRLAKESPEVFCRLLARLVPIEVAAKVENVVSARIIDLSTQRVDPPRVIEALPIADAPLHLRTTASLPIDEIAPRVVELADPPPPLIIRPCPRWLDEMTADFE